MERSNDRAARADRNEADHQSHPGKVLDIVVKLRAQKQPFALATVIETEGSVSARTGDKAIIGHDGRVIAGWVGGGCAESEVGHTALECLGSGQGQVADLDLDDEVLGTGMPCGGKMRVFIEPVLAEPTLWILGHGRVAECLCQMGSLIGLNIAVDDPLADQEHYPGAQRLLTEDLDYSALTPAAQDYIIVATQHKGDRQSMQRALKSKVETSKNLPKSAVS